MTGVFEICTACGEKKDFKIDFVEAAACKSGLSFILTFDDFKIDVNVKSKGNDCPFEISFVASKDVALSYAALYAELPAGKVLFYDAACCTNAFARILEYDEEKSPKDYFARDIFMAKGEDGGFVNFAFATFERFYTRFRFTEGRKIRAEFELENKIVKAGEKYVLEQLFVDDSLAANDFFELYTDYLAAFHKIPEFKYIPKGWSSWSCYYGSADEEKVVRQAENVKKELYGLGANLIQLDDGWQKDGSFGAYWTDNFEKYPNGMKGLKKTLDGLGLDFGLWYAPGLVRDTSENFDNFNDLLVRQPDGSLLKCFGGDNALTADRNGAIYALDIGKEKVLEMTREIFKRATEEYGVTYFKIDFITNLLYRVAFGTPVQYESDYSVALYKKWTKLIRETVGEDKFMLSCGAPVGESIGVFDAIRVSPDISWGGAGKNGAPTPFKIITLDAQNIILRSFYHKKVFVNDPDALLVRDYQTPYEDDSLVLSDDEAKLWATVVLTSGGHILVNEELDKLSPERLALVKKVYELSEELSSLTENDAARPKDFFEFPYATETYIKLKGNDEAYLCALYNWGEEPCKKEFVPGDYFGNDKEKYLFKDVFSGETETLTVNAEGKIVFDMAPHSSRCFIVENL